MHLGKLFQLPLITTMTRAMLFHFLDMMVSHGDLLYPQAVNTSCIIAEAVYLCLMQSVSISSRVTLQKHMAAYDH